MKPSCRADAHAPAGVIAILPALAWAVLVATTIVFRPLLPIDETRYLAVAWDMHRTGNWLVPHLNGETYAHKPPLMFWLMNAGWAVFGVAEWWARLVAPLSALGAAIVTGALARRLVPGGDGRAAFATASTILLGTFTFAIYSTLALFDAMMTLFSVLAVYGLVVARTGASRGFAIFGIAIGFGLLAKGPVILVYTLPPMLFAPLWVRQPPGGSWTGWYRGGFLGVLLGAAIGLAWAIPAAISGGDAYAGELLWKQSSGRVVESFAHRQPVWWYVAILPGLVFPWSAWPPLWRAIAKPRWREGEGIRLCIVWFAAGLVVMSLVSGKQPHYILPLFPAFAIFLAIHVASRPPLQRDQRWPALVLGIIGAVVVALALIPPLCDAVRACSRIAAGQATAALVAGSAWILIAGAAALLPADHGRAVTTLAMTTGFVLVVLHVAVSPIIREQFDMAPFARAVGALQREGSPVAFVGEYHGELQFAGRLAPLDTIELQDLPAWAARNPDGYVVTLLRAMPAAPAPEIAQRLRGRFLAIWKAAIVGQDPQVLTHE